ncbi:MAG: hydrolase [Clostridia bacterium]|jgi:uncharacterized protein|nr:hydrolase [Clostridia bacterium]MCI1959865.1 hydrolase [Clostridia bacterium]MCI2000308.1 hydrolase [Clostridia bacterium]MCI2015488.1 hydrolase [Clostridia bacterium]
MKAIFSKYEINDESKLTKEYLECVNDILENETYMKLQDVYQHHYTSRYQHCVNVSYYSFVFCRFVHFDKRSAARAGLLHDFYFYDWHRPLKIRKNHILWHPLVAYDNARKQFDVNNIEEDAIKRHMWPGTPLLPKYKEGVVVSIADKFCATMEFFAGFGERIKNK